MLLLPLFDPGESTRVKEVDSTNYNKDNDYGDRPDDMVTLI
jgi:hypothetical protein